MLSERPKLYGVLAVLSATGLINESNGRYVLSVSSTYSNRNRCFVMNSEYAYGSEIRNFQARHTKRSSKKSSMKRKQDFCFYFAANFSEDLLEKHECEVARLKQYYETHEEVLSRVGKREELFNQMIEFEVSSNSFLWYAVLVQPLL